MKNWKTTASSLISAVAAFIYMNPSCCSTLLHQIAGFIALGGLASVGIFSKDADTHSTPSEVASAGLWKGK